MASQAETSGIPNKETVAVRESLEKGYKTLLSQRGVGLNAIIAKDQGLQVVLQFEEEDLDVSPPDDVKNFIADQYPGREISIREIEYFYFQYGLGDVMRPHDATSVITIKVSPRQALEAEQGMGDDWIVLPNQEHPRSVYVNLVLHDTPMTYRVGNDWSEAPVKLEPSLVESLARILPDPEGGPTLLDRLIELNVIPSEAENLAYERRRKSLAESLPQPAKVITLYGGAMTRPPKGITLLG